MKAFYGLIGMIMMGTLSACATLNKCAPDGCPGDSDITAAVQAKIEQHPDLQGINTVHVQTLNRVVYLTGQVSDGLEARIAGSIARDTKGVASVENSISVTK